MAPALWAEEGSIILISIMRMMVHLKIKKKRKGKLDCVV